MTILPPDRIGIILLAAGRSTRFGAADKSAALLHGHRLIDWPIALADRIPAARRVIVRAGPTGAGSSGAESNGAAANVAHPPGSGDMAATGWETVIATDAARGLGHSLAAGIRALARDPAIDAALILLGDMPLVTLGHLDALIALAQDAPAARHVLIVSAPGPAGATSGDGPPNGKAARRPPALIGRHWFADLMVPDGDRGARHLLQSARLVCAADPILIDIDTPDDYARAALHPPPFPLKGGGMRTANILRETSETSIRVELNLDGTGQYRIATGIGFLDHMLEQLSRHSLIDLVVECKGDLHIDQHHTTEDTGIAIGEALAKALGDKRGITRYGTAYAPMDETLTRAALDISGRPWLVWKVALAMPQLGAWDTELIEHWFHSFAGAAGITLHVENLYGSNNHHIVESCFKALARALRIAVEIDPRKADQIPSTKGTLGG